MSPIKTKLILTIPMLILSFVIFTHIVNLRENDIIKMVYFLIGLFFIYEPIRIILYKNK
jgi:hypothetical protein